MWIRTGDEQSSGLLPHGLGFNASSVPAGQRPPNGKYAMASALPDFAGAACDERAMLRRNPFPDFRHRSP